MQWRQAAAKSIVAQGGTTVHVAPRPLHLLCLLATPVAGCTWATGSILSLVATYGALIPSDSMLRQGRARNLPYVRI
jgi:hypothetical protein